MEELLANQNIAHFNPPENRVYYPKLFILTTLPQRTERFTALEVKTQILTL